MSNPQLFSGYEGAPEAPYTDNPAKKIKPGAPSWQAESRRRDDLHAKDHLVASQQFTPITTVNKMESGDFPGNTIGQVHAQLYSEPHVRESTWGDYDWPRLHREVAEKGLQKPLVAHEFDHTDEYGQNYKGLFYNGHHRAMVAIDQGHMFVPTTDDGRGQYGTQGYEGPKNLEELRKYNAAQRAGGV